MMGFSRDAIRTNKTTTPMVVGACWVECKTLSTEQRGKEEESKTIALGDYDQPQ